jgi:hypothetical protein
MESLMFKIDKIYGMSNDKSEWIRLFRKKFAK